MMSSGFRHGGSMLVILQLLPRARFNFKVKEKEEMKPIKSIDVKEPERASKSLKITIKQVENRPNEYIAYYRSEFLNATYLVYFRDNIFGSVALHEFSEMLRSKYRGLEIEFIISAEKLRFKSKALEGALG